MSVHIDELHTDVVPTGTGTGAPSAQGDVESVNPWAAEERWREIHSRTEWLAARVGAVDFDD
ncbi:hypothetical protein TUSST3_64800 [Streptomyces sp. TUS-ST3]|jgi:hypothetical protein|uniref:hypothetical protein n=1 Tax=Streptomyces sp. TUS-ST3 TaxID=3025591 RepID=UPI00235B48AD|nr:hypothetical protein [Streptomyces sp. TUS-ST3]GLP69859.1 hypothetical protein TUSST3_64800 [Streptomyces sp. TUS-ST3]